MSRHRILAALALAAAACGSSTTSNNNNDGNNNNNNNNGSASQIAFAVAPVSCTIESTTVSIASLAVLISTNRTIPSACAAVEDPCVSYANLHSVILMVANYDAAGGTAPAVAAGTYDLASTPSALTGTLAFAMAGSTDATCTATSEGDSATGTITLTSVTATAVAGSYDVTVGTTHETGSIAAGVCSTAFPGDACSFSPEGTCSGQETCQP